LDGPQIYFYTSLMRTLILDRGKETQTFLQGSRRPYCRGKKNRPDRFFATSNRVSSGK
jgi:hypothetical protein